MQELLILHRTQTKESVSLPGVQSWITCRRQLFFSLHEEALLKALQPGDELLRGISAERRMIEILCGLHSPLVGETEVFGQFREWFESVQFSDWAKFHRAKVEEWFSLVKKLREKYLKGSGSQSYGSLLRRLLQQEDRIAIMGAGHLVREILPWLSHKRLTVLARNHEKAELLRAIHADMKIAPLDSSPQAAVLVIAAPLAQEELEIWLQKNPQILWIVDLRKNFLAPSGSSLRYTSLDDLSFLLEEKQQELQRIRSYMLQEISQWCERSLARVLVRPYGWEDLCL